MKKIVLFCTATLFTVLSLHAQCPLKVGGVQANAGLGFSGEGIPIYAGIDYGLVKDVTIGAKLSIMPNREHDVIIGFSTNGNYHFNTLLDIPKEWDFYAGLTTGYYINNYYGFGINAQIGGRYFFRKNLGLNLELGGGTISGGTFGITWLF